MMLKNPISAGSNVNGVGQVGMIKHPSERREYGWRVALFIFGCERRYKANFHECNPRSDMASCNLRSATAQSEWSGPLSCNNFPRVKKIRTRVNRASDAPRTAKPNAARHGVDY